MPSQHQLHSHEQLRQRQAARPTFNDMATRSASYQGQARARNDESWVEVSSQPSSSSLSSVADEVVTTGLRVQHEPRSRRRRTLRLNSPSNLNITAKRASSVGNASSQEEFDESESESDRVMTSSGEGPLLPLNFYQNPVRPPLQSSASEDSVPQVSDDDDEDRTAINYPIHNEACFTPQPNAFSHPPMNRLQNIPDSYFAQSSRPNPSGRASRQPTPSQQSHLPQNILSPSYNPAHQHDEALRASLSTLLSCAAAARGLSKSNEKSTTTAENKQKQQQANTPRPRSTRIEPNSFRLVPESALNATSPPPQLHDATFKPTIRRSSTSSASSKPRREEAKRKATRSKSAERRAVKKARRSSSTDELIVTPTLLTWAVSAGVVVALTALSFSAGYSMGKEAGRLEANGFPMLGGVDESGSCAKEVSRSSMGLKRAMARSAVQV